MNQPKQKARNTHYDSWVKAFMASLQNNDGPQDPGQDEKVAGKEEESKSLKDTSPQQKILKRAKAIVAYMHSTTDDPVCQDALVNSDNCFNLSKLGGETWGQTIVKKHKVSVPEAPKKRTALLFKTKCHRDNDILLSRLIRSRLTGQPSKSITIGDRSYMLSEENNKDKIIAAAETELNKINAPMTIRIKMIAWIEAVMLSQNQTQRLLKNKIDAIRKATKNHFRGWLGPNNSTIDAVLDAALGLGPQPNQMRFELDTPTNESALYHMPKKPTAKPWLNFWPFSTEAKQILQELNQDEQYHHALIKTQQVDELAGRLAQDDEKTSQEDQLRLMATLSELHDHGLLTQAGQVALDALRQHTLDLQEAKLPTILCQAHIKHILSLDLTQVQKDASTFLSNAAQKQYEASWRFKTKENLKWLGTQVWVGIKALGKGIAWLGIQVWAGIKALGRGIAWLGTFIWKNLTAIITNPFKTFLLIVFSPCLALHLIYHGITEGKPSVYREIRSFKSGNFNIILAATGVILAPFFALDALYTFFSKLSAANKTSKSHGGQEARDESKSEQKSIFTSADSRKGSEQKERLSNEISREDAEASLGALQTTISQSWARLKGIDPEGTLYQFKNGKWANTAKEIQGKQGLQAPDAPTRKKIRWFDGFLGKTGPIEPQPIEKLVKYCAFLMEYKDYGLETKSNEIAPLLQYIKQEAKKLEGCIDEENKPLQTSLEAYREKMPSDQSSVNAPQTLLMAWHHQQWLRAIQTQIEKSPLLLGKERTKLKNIITNSIFISKSGDPLTGKPAMTAAELKQNQVQGTRVAQEGSFLNPAERKSQVENKMRHT